MTESLIDGVVDGAAVPPVECSCRCSRAVLAQALDAVMSLDVDAVEGVLALAEARRAGVRAALAAAFEAEAGQLAALSRRAYAAADRLAPEPRR